MFRLLTPGGGGYGSSEDSSSHTNKSLEPPRKRQRHLERGSVYEYARLQESS